MSFERACLGEHAGCLCADETRGKQSSLVPEAVKSRVTDPRCEGKPKSFAPDLRPRPQPQTSAPNLSIDL